MSVNPTCCQQTAECFRTGGNSTQGFPSGTACALSSVAMVACGGLWFCASASTIPVPAAACLPPCCVVLSGMGCGITGVAINHFKCCEARPTALTMTEDTSSSSLANRESLTEPEIPDPADLK